MEGIVTVHLLPCSIILLEMQPCHALLMATMRTCMQYSAASYIVWNVQTCTVSAHDNEIYTCNWRYNYIILLGVTCVFRYALYYV